MPLVNPFSGGSWITLTLSSQYAAAGSPFLTPAYRKDSFGIVYIRGTASYVSGTVINFFNLPVGFRPTASARYILYAIDSNNQSSNVRVTLKANGDLFYEGGSAFAVSFDPISFATY